MDLELAGPLHNSPGFPASPNRSSSIHVLYMLYRAYMVVEHALH